MSNFMKKALLFFPESESNSKNFFESTDMDRWGLTQVNDIDHAKKLITENDYRVGMIYIKNNHPNFLLQIKDLVSMNKFTNWIALINDSMMLNPLIRETIVNYFYDYHRFPIDKSKLLAILGHAYGMSDLAQSIIIRNYDESIQKNYVLFGKSDAMKNVRQQIVRMAPVAKTVLITGESGTGKELAARALHQLSKRSGGPLITVNTAALSPNLIQSELFGHEKGAFTGAHQTKIGKIEAAHKGTILLDEIGDVTPDIQVALLRFLQEKTIERLGSTDSINLDVRVIAATHRNLEQSIINGTFREDLYYRLNTLHLNIPPLRERGDDLMELAYFSLDKFLKEQSKSKPKDFSVSSLKIMNNHSWPGNVRELISRIESAVLLCDDNLISPKHLGLERRNNSRHVKTIEEARKQAEQEAIKNAVQYTNGNLTKAAEVLGISRASLYRLYNPRDQINSSGSKTRNNASFQH